MRIHTLSALFLTASLAACGGGGGGDGGPGVGGGPVTATYKSVTPVQGQWQSYTETVTDVGNKSASFSYTDTITQVNSDGSYSVSSVPAGGVVTYTLDGANYEIDPYAYTFDSRGQIAQSHNTTFSASDVCVATYTNGGMPSSVTVGQSWDDTHTWTCQGQADGSSGGLATLVDVEALTVPAGTFTAYKFQEVQTVPDASGPGVTTTTTTTWRNDSLTDTRVLKTATQTVVTGRTAAASQIQSNVAVLSSYK